MNLDFIANPLGMVLKFLYEYITFENYGLSIIAFTFIVRLAMMPLTVKQYRSTAKMQELQPMIAEIQKKYKNDKEKLQQETMKFYSENKYNPAGGCLPSLVQLPIFLSLYWVIAQPLKFMLKMDAAEITDLAEKFSVSTKNTYYQIEIIKNDPTLLNLNFLGMNLGDIPSLNNPSVLWLVPILAALTTYWSSKMLQTTSTQSTDNQMASSMNKSMLTIFPLMSGYFAFMFPLGMGIYWIAGYLIQMIQQFILKKFILKK